MEDIRLNISGSYEESGWKNSLVSLSGSSNKDWMAKFGDIRGDMGFLNTLDAWRIIDSVYGVYYSKIIKNPACSRGGVIQITIFAPVKSIPTDAKCVCDAIESIAVYLNENESKIEKFFDSDEEALSGLHAVSEKALKSISVKDDAELVGRKTVETQSSQVVYRRYSTIQDVYSYFALPHQDAYADYKSIYFINQSVNVKDKAKEITDKLQRVFSIINDKDVYCLLEGTSYDIPLKSHPQMDPKVLPVVANCRNTNAYKFEGEKIIVDEKNIKFQRPFKLAIKFPSDVPETYDFDPRIDNCSDLIEQKKNDGTVLEFVANLNTSIDIRSNYYQLVDRFINPSVESEKTLYLRLVARDVKLVFTLDDKPIFLNHALPVSLSGKNVRTECNEKKCTYGIHKLIVGQSYSVEISNDSYKVKDNFKFVVEKSGTAEILVPLEIKAATISTKIGDIELKGTSNDINPEKSKYSGYTYSKNGANNYVIKTVPSIFKPLAIAFGALSVLFLASTIFFAIQALGNNPEPQQYEEVISEQPVNEQVSDTVSSDSLQSEETKPDTTVQQ